MAGIFCEFSVSLCDECHLFISRTDFLPWRGRSCWISWRSRTGWSRSGLSSSFWATMWAVVSGEILYASTELLLFSSQDNRYPLHFAYLLPEAVGDKFVSLLLERDGKKLQNLTDKVNAQSNGDDQKAFRLWLLSRNQSFLIWKFWKGSYRYRTNVDVTRFTFTFQDGRIPCHYRRIFTAEERSELLTQVANLFPRDSRKWWLEASCASLRFPSLWYLSEVRIIGNAFTSESWSLDLGCGRPCISCPCLP